MNPFDDEAARFQVVVNHEGQHALWPGSAAVPGGWSAVHGPDARESCLEYVRVHWDDMRPRSLDPSHDDKRRS